MMRGHSMPGVSNKYTSSAKARRCSLLVTPASSAALAARLPIKRLMSVDLPTFGIPQIKIRKGLVSPKRLGARAWLSRTKACAAWVWAVSKAKARVFSSAW